MPDSTSEGELFTKALGSIDRMEQKNPIAENPDPFAGISERAVESASKLWETGPTHSAPSDSGEPENRGGSTEPEADFSNTSWGEAQRLAQKAADGWTLSSAEKQTVNAFLEGKIPSPQSTEEKQSTSEDENLPPEIKPEQPPQNSEEEETKEESSEKKKFEQMTAFLGKKWEQARGVHVPGWVIDTVAGAATGFLAREGGKRILMLALGGPSGFAVVGALGALGGGASGATREWLKINREVNEKIAKLKEENDPELEQRKKELKDKLFRNNAKRIGLKALRGAVIGTASAITINGLFELGEHFLSSSEAPVTSELSNPPASGGEQGLSQNQDVPRMGPVGGEEGASPSGTTNPEPLNYQHHHDLSSNTGETGGNSQLGDATANGAPTSEPLNYQHNQDLTGNTGQSATPGVEQLTSIDQVVGHEIIIPEGSNPWNQMSGVMEKALGHPATNEQILAATKALCEANHIAVPEWGLGGDGWIPQNNIPAGTHLVVNDNVLNAIKAAAKA